jgi:predicted Zn finger-like uncharacterized protein
MQEGAHASDSPAMILTCPNCATRYFVDDARIGPAGQVVRCAACSERWTAHPPEPETLLEEEAPLTAFEPAPPPPEPVEAEETPFRETPADDLPRAFRERAQTRRKVRQAAAAGVIWAAVAGVLAVGLGLSLLLRQQVAELWPKTAGVYAMIGLPVNLVGLAIEDQHARPALKDGHAAVIITGSLRNVRDKPVAAPALRVSLLNPAGKPLAVKIADPGGALIPPGEARRFVVDMLDPPVSATDVEVAFVLGGPSHRPRPALAPAAVMAGPPPAATLSLRGAAAADPAAQNPAVAAPPPGAVQDARPLPASSPYALHQDATGGPNG